MGKASSCDKLLLRLIRDEPLFFERGGGGEKFTGTNNFFSATSTQTIFFSGDGFANIFFSTKYNALLYEEFYVTTSLISVTTY